MSTQIEETGKSSKDIPPSKNGNHGLPTGGALDELKDAALSDPFFSFIHKYGNLITVVCLGIGLLFLYLQQSDKAFQESMQESARVLREGRMMLAEYQTLVESRNLVQQKIDGTYELKEGESLPEMEELKKQLAKVDAAITTAETTIQGKFDVLSQSRGGYGAMGRAYQVLLAIGKGDLEVASSKLEGLSWKSQVPGSAERMYYELAALSLARAYLDTEDKLVDGVAQLKELARNGQTAHVPAALAVANIATTEVEREEAKSLLQSLLQKHPEQAEVLEPQIKALS